MAFDKSLGAYPGQPEGRAECAERDERDKCDRCDDKCDKDIKDTKNSVCSAIRAKSWARGAPSKTMETKLANIKSGGASQEAQESTRIYML